MCAWLCKILAQTVVQYYLLWKYKPTEWYTTSLWWDQYVRLLIYWRGEYLVWILKIVALKRVVCMCHPLAVPSLSYYISGLQLVNICFCSYLFFANQILFSFSTSQSTGCICLFLSIFPFSFSDSYVLESGIVCSLWWSLLLLFSLCDFP